MLNGPRVSLNSTQFILKLVTAFVHNFRPLVEQQFWVTPQDFIFFTEADITFTRSALVWEGLFVEGPFYLKGNVLFLKFPNILWKASLRLPHWVREWSPVVRISLFPHRLSRTQVPSCQCTCRDISMVHKCSLCAFTIEGAVGFVSRRAVAVVAAVHSCRLREDLLVVFRDDWFHVWSAAVTYLQCVLVEYLIVLVLAVKVFLDYVDELSTNVCFDWCIVWWGEPNRFPCACVSSSWRLCLEFNVFIESAIFQCLLVGIFHLVELGLITGDAGYALLHHGWEPLRDCRWVVRILVDV